MGYTLYDNQGQVITNAELQNRGPWYAHGIRKELMFVERFGANLDVVINPSKDRDVAAPDLLQGQQFLGDLKCQNTPFFSAERYRMQAQTSVTFNLKDAFAYQKYLATDDPFLIYFWVDWIAVSMVNDYGETSVTPMHGVWKIDFHDLDRLRKAAPIHWYGQRAKNDEHDPRLALQLAEFEPRLRHGNSVSSIRSGAGGNAACSYIIDLDNFERLI